MKLLRILKLTAFCALISILAGCSSSSSSSSFKIGIDHSFFPIDAMGQEKNIYGFTQDVLAEVAAKHKINVSYMPINWDTVISSLKDKKVDAVISTLRPYVFYQKEFDFSMLFLPTGPVLLTQEKASYKNLRDFSGKVIGIIAGSGDELFIETHPGIIIRSFDAITDMLEALMAGDIEGATLDTLLANAYCRDLFQGRIKIISSVLNDEGLRMMTLKDEHKAFIEEFNSTLETLKDSKQYQELLAKWQLNMPCE